MMSTADRARPHRAGGFRRSSGWKPSLALSFAAFSIFVCLFATIVCIVDLAHARKVAVAVARRETENLTQSLAQQVSDNLDTVDGALLALAERADAVGSPSTARTRLRDTMAALVATVPRIRELAVVDERGRFVAGSLPATETRMLAVGAQPYFLHHRSHPGSDVLISEVATGTTGVNPLLVATRRLGRPDGSFAGVAVASLDMDAVEQTFAAVDVGRLGSIALVLSDGTVIVRRPRASIGEKLRADPMFGPDYKDIAAASYVAASPVDGVRRLFAFERLGRHALIVRVGLAESEYLAAWHADALANYLALAFGTAFIGALAAGVGGQIARRKRAENTLALLPVDVLTGLANRNRFDVELDREWRRAAQEHEPLGLVMIEVCNLKAYNDRYGHEEGDALLISFARTISNIVAPTSVAARYSGLELAVLLPATDENGAQLLAERIRVAILGLVARDSGASGATVRVTLGSAGLVPESAAAKPALLVGAAFVALHHAKQEGGDALANLPADALTGLANRRRFDAELDREWRRAAQERIPLGLLVVEVDNLKAYNDRYGRERGDDLLISIARTISLNNTVSGHLTARYSGLELAMILPATDEAAALAFAERMSVALRGLDRNGGGRPGVTVTVSIGTATQIPEIPDGASLLVGAAFLALHAGKRESQDDARTGRTASDTRLF
jgi:diguanylate cyclase (GGDEF)-like protein